MRLNTVLGTVSVMDSILAVDGRGTSDNRAQRRKKLATVYRKHAQSAGRNLGYTYTRLSDSISESSGRRKK